MADINRIIKEARNTLVGKVPDPQSQIDQITLALIYKFMDAKDKEAVALGLQPQFFVGEYANYSFSDIMSAPSNPKQFELYTKGIDLLQKRIDLPETFVSVFKDAFVPYRDAQTLHLFLNEIDKIPTDNTELLGTAFEDLLSIMGSQGDAGQFRTPRHIIDMIVEIVEPKTGESILDPACGTAGFLISAYNKINKQDLTIEERDKLINEGLVGYDINPNMVKLASVNLFLHGCKKPNIHLYDTLTEKDFWKDNYDVILANPPFMTPKGGIRPHELFSAINANRSEVLFTYYIAKHLRRDGRAGIIVPEGVVFQSANAYKNLRKMLVEENYLYAAISLPAGVFNPYSGVKTSVLLFDKALARKTDKILFVKMNNDGFDLGAQRRPIDKNDIPVIVDTVKRFISCVSTETESDFVDEIGLSSVVNKSRIAENDYILVGDRYKSTVAQKSEWPMVELGAICSFIRGLTYKKEEEAGEITSNGVLRANNIDMVSNSLDLSDVKYLIEDHDYDHNKKVRENDILLCASSGSKQHLGKVALIPEHIDMFFGGFMGVLRPHGKVNAKYLYYNLTSNYYKNFIASLLAGANINNIRGGDLCSFKIPLPPLEIQEQIVEELDSYQKIVDGARQVVENYKPTINVDPNWDVLRLGDICLEIKNGVNVEQIDNKGKYRVTRIQTIANGVVDIQRTKWTNDEPSENYFMQAGDILISHINSYEHLAKAAIFPDVDEKVIHGINLIRCRLDRKKIDPNYAIIYMKSSCFIDNARIYAQRAVNQASIKVSDLKKIEIPIPSIEEQQQIVEEINEEMTIIEQNKRLIEIFEQKINAKINEVWGSEIK